MTEGERKRRSHRAGVAVVALILLTLSVLCCGSLWSNPEIRTPQRLAPLGTPVAGRFVEIQAGFSCESSSDYMVLTGKVKNTGSRMLRSVRLRAAALTENGEIVNTTTGYIDSDILAAGATSTFKIYVDDPDGEASQCRIAVQDASRAIASNYADQNWCQNDRICVNQSPWIATLRPLTPNLGQAAP